MRHLGNPERQQSLLLVQALLSDMQKGKTDLSAESLLSIVKMTYAQAQSEHDDVFVYFDMILATLNEEGVAVNEICYPEISRFPEHYNIPILLDHSGSLHDLLHALQFESRFPPVLIVGINQTLKDETARTFLDFNETEELKDRRYHLKFIVVYAGILTSTGTKGHFWLFIRDNFNAESTWTQLNDSAVTAEGSFRNVLRKINDPKENRIVYGLVYVDEKHIHDEMELHHVQHFDLENLIPVVSKVKEIAQIDETVLKSLKTGSEIYNINYLTNFSKIELRLTGKKRSLKTVIGKTLPSLSYAVSQTIVFLKKGDLENWALPLAKIGRIDYPILKGVCNEDEYQEYSNVLSNCQLSESDFINAIKQERGIDNLQSRHGAEISNFLPQLIAKYYRAKDRESHERPMFSSYESDTFSYVVETGLLNQSNASDLYKSTSLTMISRPVYCSDYSFLNHHGVSTFLELKRKYSSDPSSNLIKEKIISDLSTQLIGNPSYMYNLRTETEITQNCLISILDLIEKEIHLDEPKSLRLTSNPSADFHFVFASGKSFSEQVILLKKRSLTFPICGSESKGAEASVFKALAQGMQIGCDCLYHLTRRLTCDVNFTAFPVILIAGHCIQIMLFYSLAEFYPVPLVVSRELNYLEQSSYQEIAEWILTIAENGRMINGQIQAGHVIVHPENVIYADFKSFFLKPIQVYVQNSPEYHYVQRLSALVDIYSRLYSVEKARQYICFPRGFISFPMGDIEPKLQKVLNDMIEMKLWRVGGSPTIITKTNLPIRIYENLKYGNHPFQDSVTEVDNEITIPDEWREQFFNELKMACTYFTEARVCHFDLRLENVMYRIFENTLEIRIVDWDYSGIFGSFLPQILQDFRDNFNANFAAINIASEEWYTFYLNIIRDRLGLSNND